MSYQLPYFIRETWTIFLISKSGAWSRVK